MRSSESRGAPALKRVDLSANAFSGALSYDALYALVGDPTVAEIHAELFIDDNDFCGSLDESLEPFASLSEGFLATGNRFACAYGAWVDVDLWGACVARPVVDGVYVVLGAAVSVVFGGDHADDSILIDGDFLDTPDLACRFDGDGGSSPGGCAPPAGAGAGAGARERPAGNRCAASSLRKSAA